VIFKLKDVVFMSEKTSGGIGIGAVIAGVLSWSANHSIVWLIFHVCCGWLYVIYYVLFK
jgi:hypothetical protein